MQLDEDAFLDTAQNGNAVLEGFRVTKSDDFVHPIFLQNNHIDLNTGVLKIRFSETIRFDQASDIDLNHIYLWEDENTTMVLDGALSVTSIEDDTAIQIVLNETQRVFAIEHSETETSGGDGLALKLSAHRAAVHDISGNPNLLQNSIPLLELEDVLSPILISPASIDLSTGVIVISSSETLDLAISGEDDSGFVDLDSGRVNLSKITLVDNSNLVNDFGIDRLVSRTANLVGARVKSHVNIGGPQEITIVLNEAQRVAAVRSAGVKPRLGSTLSLIIDNGAVRDTALVRSTNGGNVITLTELVDKNPPTIESAYIDYGSGLLSITTSETLDGFDEPNVGSTLTMGRFAVPALIDLDQDDDLDMLVGIERGEVLVHINEGTQAYPKFRHISDNNLMSGSVINGFFSSANAPVVMASGFAAPSTLKLVDPQCEHLDLAFGEKDGTLHYFENTGYDGSTCTGAGNVFNNARPACSPGATNQNFCNPFTFITGSPSLTFARAAQDNTETTVHVWLSSSDGTVKYSENNGDNPTIQLSDWTEIDSGNANKLSSGGVLVDHGERASVATGEIYHAPCSGPSCRPDIMVGTRAGIIFTYQYVVNELAGDRIIAHDGISNPAREVDLRECCGGYAAPALYDVTGDSKLDLFVGAADGSVHFYENTGTSTAPYFTPRPALVFDGTPVSQQSPLSGFVLASISLDDKSIKGALPNEGPNFPLRLTATTPVVQSLSDRTINLTLTTDVTASAILHSRPFDGDALFLRVKAYGISDISNNANLDVLEVQLIEAPDRIKPEIVHVTVNYAVGRLSVNFNEYMLFNESLPGPICDGIATDLGPSRCDGTYVYSKRGVDLAKIFLSDVPGFKNISLAGATVLPVTNSTVNLILTEQQRVNAIELSGTPGGDTKAIFLDVDADAFNDLSNNGIAQEYNITILERLDDLIPIMQPATLEYGPGILRIAAQEFIDMSSIDLSRIFISDEAGDKSISLNGSTLKEGSIDGFEIDILLTEEQRALAISISGLPGGNQHGPPANGLQPVVVDFEAGALTDIAQSPNAEQLGVQVTEVKDVTPPVLLSGTIDYNNGIVTITASETVDMTLNSIDNFAPVADLTKIVLVNDYTSTDNFFNLNPSPTTKMIRTNGVTITIQLNEAQRAKAVTYSNTPGGGGTNSPGDGAEIAIRIDPGAFKDLAGNPNVAIAGRTPYNFTSGNCIGVATDQYDNAGEQECLRHNGTLYVSPKCKDSNGIDAPGGISVLNSSAACEGTHILRLTETADITPPILLSEEIDYGLGILTLVFSETIDVKPPESLCLPNNVVGGTKVACIGLTGNSYTPAKCIGGSAHAVPYTTDTDGSTCTTGSGNYTPASCTNGGDPSSEVACEGPGEKVGYTFTPGTIDLTLLRIDNTSDPGDLGAYHLQDLSIRNTQFTDITLSARLNLAQVDDPSVVLIFSESERTHMIGYSGTIGGDSPYPNISKTFVDENSSLFLDMGQGAFKDLSGNLVLQKLDTVLTEIPDNKGPTFVNRAPHLLDLNDGTLIIRSHKTLNIDPIESLHVPIDLRKVYISESGSSLDVVLTGAKLVSTADSIDLTLQLTEAQRVGAVFLSNTPGGGGTFSTGDGSPVFLALQNGAVMDTARNFNNDSFGLLVSETPDTRRPRITEVSLDLNDGRLRITSDETLDVTPESYFVIDFASIVVSNKTRNPPFEVRDFVICTDPAYNRDTDGCTGLTGYEFVPAAGSDCSIDNIGTHDNDEVLCTGITGNIFTPSGCSNNPTHKNNQASCEAGSGVFYAAKCATCTNGGDASSEFACSGITGNTFTYAKCSGGNFPADPYYATDDGLNCSTEGGDYTPATCTNGGNTSSQIACEGANVNGNLYNETGGDATSQAACEGTATGHVFKHAHGDLCLDWFGQDTGNSGSAVLCEGLPTGNEASLRPFAYKDSAFVLTGARVEQTDGTTVTVVLTEEQRSSAIQFSSTPGGDGASSYLSVKRGALRDMSNNSIVEKLNVDIIEIADTTRPIVESASLEFSTGILSLNLSEIVDCTTVVDHVDLGKILLVDHFIDSPGLFSIDLGGATVLDFEDTQNIRIRLTEHQRTASIIKSGVEGGDTNALYIQFLSGAFSDVAGNPSTEILDMPLKEQADTEKPEFYEGVLDFNTGTGVLTLTSTEFLDLALGSDGVAFTGNTFTPPNLCTNNGDSSSRRACEELRLSAINVSNIFLADAAGEQNISLQGSYVAPVAFSLRSHDLVIYLTEQQRVDAIALSGTPGGDGSALFANIFADIVAGYGTRGNAGNRSVTLTEIPDTTPPRLLSATIDLGRGIVTLLGSEFIDATPSSNVDPSLITLVQDTEIVENAVNLAGALVTAIDGYTITLLMNEQQRVAAVAISATPGGDGVPMRMDCQAGAVIDVSANPSLVSNDLAVNEIADTINPTLLSATFDFNNRMFVVECSETISVITTNLKTGSLVDQSLLILADQTGVHDNPESHVPISGATLINSADSTKFTLQLTEAQKVTVQLFSATAGGDGTGFLFTPSSCSNNGAFNSSEAACIADSGQFTPNVCSMADGTIVSDDGTGLSASISSCTGASVLDVLGGAFSDMSHNPVQAFLGLSVDEISDITAPKVVSAILDYGLSTLTVGLDEFVAAKNNNNDPTDETVYVDLSDFLFRDIHTAYNKYAEIKTRYAGQDFAPKETVAMLDAEIKVDASHRTSSVKFDISEATRATLVRMSGVPGGDRFPIIPYGSTADHVCKDIDILISSGCADGDIALGAPVGGNPNDPDVVDIRQSYYYYDPGAVILDIFVGGLRDMASNPSAEITDCRERCTNDQSAFCEIDDCPAPETRGIVVTEIPDTVRPTVRSVVVDFGMGEIRIRASETLDANSPEDINLDTIFFADIAGGQDVPLTGATVQKQLSQTLTIGLSEAIRIAAMTIAGTPGGDGTKITLTISNSSVQDISNNFMLAANIEGDILTELPDTVGPRLISSTLNLSTGELVLHAYETIDISPSTDLQLGLITFRGDADHLPIGSAGYTGENGNGVSLAGATILSEV